MSFKIAVCAIFKDENKYIKEWVDYHLGIGFDSIFIYDNLSKIPVKHTLKNYINKGTVTTFLWNKQETGKQTSAYDDSLKKLSSFDFVAYIDIDEFIVLLDESANIKDYLIEFKEYSAIGLNWLVFGANGHDKTQQSVLRSYTQACPTHGANKHIKTIACPKKTIRSRDPHHFSTNGDTVNVYKDKISGPFNDPPILNHKMRINHYITRSKEDFELKQKRGSGDGKNKKYTENFFNSHQKENVKNIDILKTLEKIIDKIHI